MCDVIELPVQVHLNVSIAITITISKLDDFWKGIQSRTEMD